MVWTPMLRDKITRNYTSISLVWLICTTTTTTTTSNNNNNNNNNSRPRAVVLFFSEPRAGRVKKKMQINGKLRRSFLRASALVSRGFAARPHACSRSTESIVMIVEIINCVNGIKNTRKTSLEIGKCEWHVQIKPCLARSGSILTFYISLERLWVVSD